MCTSTHSVEPTSMCSSASQLHSIRVLPGLQSTRQHGYNTHNTEVENTMGTGILHVHVYSLEWHTILPQNTESSSNFHQHSCSWVRVHCSKDPGISMVTQNNLSIWNENKQLNSYDNLYVITWFHSTINRGYDIIDSPLFLVVVHYEACHTKKRSGSL